jgi:zinc protease
MSIGPRLAATVAAMFISLAGAAFAQGETSAVDKAIGKASSAVEPKGPDPDVIQADPAVRRGTLPNGLRYAVIRNDKPAGGASLRLIIGSGAFNEEPGERGAAHFVEHMVFEPGDPGEDYIGRFQAAGVTFGRDQNAATNLFDTDYLLDLPKADEATLDLAFRWLRGVAGGAAFRADAVEREKGVLIAEHNLRTTPLMRQYERDLALRGAGLRSTDRQGSEPPEAIKAMTPSRLAAFYARWYRPSNAVVVMVADLPPEVMQKRIEQAFGSWKANGPPARPPALGEPAARPEAPAVLISNDANIPAMVSICRVGRADPTPINDVPALRRKMLPHAWANVLNHRFQRSAALAKPPFTGAVASFSDEGREAAYACVSALPVGGDWRAAVAGVETELRRMSLYGPTAAETEGAIKEVRNLMLSGALRYGEKESKAIADELADSDLRGEIFPSAFEAWRAMDVAIEGVTPERLKAAFVKDWSGAGPYLTMASPSPPQDEALKAAWAAAGGGADPARATEEKLAAWGYSNFGRAGKIVRREVFHDPEFVRLTFANGVVLKLMHTGFDRDQTEVRVRFGSGRREVANGDFNFAVFGGAMLPVGALGKHDLETVRGLFAGKTWSVAMNASESAFVLSGRTSPWDLQSELQLLAAFCDDPGFRSDIDARLPTAVAAGYQMRRADAASAMLLALYAQVWPGAPNQMPPEDVARGWRTADFARVLKPALTHDPLDVVIVGDVSEETAVKMVAETFGALRSRKAAPAPRPDTWFLRFPKAPAPAVHATVEASENAAVGAVWPLYVATPERRREEYALTLLSRILSDALFARVRQTLGKSYTPAVDAPMPDSADQGMLMAVLDSAPADADLVRGEILAAARRLAAGEISQAALERARQPLLADIAVKLKTNALWADALSAAREYPAALDEVRTSAALIGAITLDEVKAAAKTWLSPAPIEMTALPRKADAR